jgi:hypothetical protein
VTAWEPILRALTYAVCLQRDPLPYVDRAIKSWIGDPIDRAESERVLEAIELGLASRENLAALLNQECSDAVIRQFLEAVRARLQSQN